MDAATAILTAITDAMDAATIIAKATATTEGVVEIAKRAATGKATATMAPQLPT